MILIALIGLGEMAASNGSDTRPSLLYREDFREIPAALPITQEHIANDAIVLGLHGPGGGQIKKSHHDKPLDDPYYVWSGQANGNWLVSLTYGTAIDLTGMAKIRWRAKQSGFRQLRIALKLRSGKWLVSNVFDGPSKDWRIKEFNISDIEWYGLKIDTVTETWRIADPDLSQVESIGWTDLMTGGSSEASSRVDWIEVYARESAEGANP